MCNIHKGGIEMKKYVFVLVVIGIIVFLSNKVIALSENFLFVINTVGIPRYNAYGYEISEEVYKTYNVFSYSEPHKVTMKGQRWKNTKYGYWAKNKGAYKGTGTRGEYYILGYSYSGAEIYNYYFPIDVLPTTTPEQWVFYANKEAEKSWKDKTKYKYEEQLEHMLNSKLMFNDLSSRAKADNPKYIKEYNITAGGIGKNKARLDAAATWKTHGIITTKRMVSGVLYSQIYLVKPMAADAEAVSNLKVNTSYVLKETEDEICIPITYGMSIEKMSGYADKKHVREIKSKLYINNKEVSEISGSKITSVGNEYMLVITRDKIPQSTTEHSIEIRTDGYVHTEFAADGLMQNSKKLTVKIFVEPKKIIPVKETNVMLLEKDVQKWVVRPLAQTLETNFKESIGFTEAGKHLVIKLILDVDSVEKAKVYLDNNLIKSENVLESKNKLILRVKIPEETITTLFGFASLREDTKKYFNMDISKIGKRKLEPHVLKVVCVLNNKEYDTEILVDTLDNYLANINTSILVSNYEQTKVRINLEEWMYE